LSDGKRFVTVRKDGQIRFWDATSGRMLTDSKVSTEGFYEIVDKRANGYGGLHSCLVSADGSLASSIFRPGRTIMGPRGGDQLEIWDANDRKAFRAIKLPPKDSVSLIALSEDGKWIATAHGSVLEIWDTKTTRSVGKIPFDRGTEPGMGLTFSKDAQFLASGSSSKVLLWDVSEFTNLAEEKMQAEEPLQPKASPRGK
jgi:WD40 repeat protein